MGRYRQFRTGGMRRTVSLITYHSSGPVDGVSDTSTSCTTSEEYASNPRPIDVADDLV